MKIRFFTLVLGIILSSAGWADRMVVSVDKANMDMAAKQLKYAWFDDKDKMPLMMTWFPQVDENGICRVHAKSNLQGVIVSLFELDAQLASDYNNLWNRSVICYYANNQINWPFYDEIVAAGETKEFMLKPLSAEPSAAYLTSKAVYHVKLQ